MLNTLVFSVVYEPDGVCPGGIFFTFFPKNGKTRFSLAPARVAWGRGMLNAF